jgi:hypothetical protein
MRILLLCLIAIILNSCCIEGNINSNPFKILLNKVGIVNNETTNISFLNGEKRLELDNISNDIIRNNSIKLDYNDSTHESYKVSKLKDKYLEFINKSKGVEANEKILFNEIAVKKVVLGKSIYLVVGFNDTIAVYLNNQKVINLKWIRNIKYDSKLIQYNDNSSEPARRSQIRPHFLRDNKLNGSQRNIVTVRSLENESLFVYPVIGSEIVISIIANNRICSYSFNGDKGRLNNIRNIEEDLNLIIYSREVKPEKEIKVSSEEVISGNDKLNVILVSSKEMNYIVMEFRNRIFLYRFNRRDAGIEIYAVILKSR